MNPLYVPGDGVPVEGAVVALLALVVLHVLMPRLDVDVEVRLVRGAEVAVGLRARDVPTLRVLGSDVSEEKFGIG